LKLNLKTAFIILKRSYMSVIKNFKKFFQNKFDVIKIDNKKELKELKKVEEQLKKLEKREDDLSRPFFRT